MRQLDFTDITANRHHNHPMSVAAHARVNTRHDRERVLAFVQMRQDCGATLDECCVYLSRMPNQLSGRFSELKRDGIITATGRKRPTRTGCLSTVYVAGSMEKGET